MEGNDVAETSVTCGADDGRVAAARPAARPLEIISDAPVCVRLDQATGELRDEPVTERRSAPVMLTFGPRPPGRAAA
jgi:hypothetical protein